MSVYSGSSSCCLCVFPFLLALFCGAGGVIVYISWKTHPTTTQTLPLALLYDDIELPTTTKHELELEHNVTYAYLN